MSLMHLEWKNHRNNGVFFFIWVHLRVLKITCTLSWLRLYLVNCDFCQNFSPRPPSVTRVHILFNSVKGNIVFIFVLMTLLYLGRWSFYFPLKQTYYDEGLEIALKRLCTSWTLTIIFLGAISSLFTICMFLYCLYKFDHFII